MKTKIIVVTTIAIIQMGCWPIRKSPGIEICGYRIEIGDEKEFAMKVISNDAELQVNNDGAKIIVTENKGVKNGETYYRIVIMKYDNNGVIQAIDEDYMILGAGGK